MSKDVEEGKGCLMFALGLALVILSIGGCTYLESLANKNNAEANSLEHSSEHR